eukprot:5045558-Amphidinium_carterae.1
MDYTDAYSQCCPAKSCGCNNNRCNGNHASHQVVDGEYTENCLQQTQAPMQLKIPNEVQA